MLYQFNPIGFDVMNVNRLVRCCYYKYGNLLHVLTILSLIRPAVIGDRFI
jgi:hypothetical protein